MRTSKKQFFWSVMFIGILVTGWTACTKSGSSYTTSPVTYVSVMNMAPYGPSTDIYLNNQPATGTGGITPGSYSNKYGPLQPGNYAITFKKNGSDSVLTSLPASILDTLNFYTLIMYNDVNKGIHSMLIHDDFSSISPGNANFRFFNLSPDAASVDFYLNTTAASSGRTPGDNDASRQLNVFQSTAPSTYDLKVKVAGKDSTLATMNGVSLVGGNVYTFFLSGTVNNGVNNLKLNLLTASY